MSTTVTAWQDLDVPLGLIWGAEDTVTPLAQAQAIVAQNGDASLLILDDLGHIPQLEDPATFNAALIRLVRELVQETE